MVAGSLSGALLHQGNQAGLLLIGHGREGSLDVVELDGLDRRLGLVGTQGPELGKLSLDGIELSLGSGIVGGQLGETGLLGSQRVDALDQLVLVGREDLMVGSQLARARVGLASALPDEELTHHAGHVVDDLRHGDQAGPLGLGTVGTLRLQHLGQVVVRAPVEDLRRFRHLLRRDALGDEGQQALRRLVREHGVGQGRQLGVSTGLADELRGHAPSLFLQDSGVGQLPRPGLHSAHSAQALERVDDGGLGGVQVGVLLLHGMLSFQDVRVLPAVLCPRCGLVKVHRGVRTAAGKDRFLALTIAIIRCAPRLLHWDFCSGFHHPKVAATPACWKAAMLLWCGARRTI